MKTFKNLSLVLLLLFIFAAYTHAQPRIEAKKEIPNLQVIKPDIKNISVSTGAALNVLLKSRTDGTAGYYLKEVGKTPSLAANENVVFYPASSIKVFEYLHAIKMLETSNLKLTDMIPSGDNGAKESLQALLNKMMFNSDNPASNALQDYFTLASINNTAYNFGGVSNNSALAHKFGMDGPKSNPMNRLTLQDICALYESVLSGKSLNKSGQKIFYENMINGPNAVIFLDGVINQEGADLGLTAQQIADFRKSIKMVWKPGWIPNSYDGFFYESIAGSVEMTTKVPSSRLIRVRKYVFGYFVSKAKNIKNTPSNLSAQVVNDMFRQSIREAMKTWKA